MLQEDRVKCLLRTSRTQDYEMKISLIGFIEPVRPGAYRLRFVHEGAITLERDITVRNNEPLLIDVSLSAAPPPPKAAEPPPPTAAQTGQGKPLGPGANRACLKKTRMSVEEIVHQSACNESYDLLSSPTQHWRQNPSKCRIHQLADSAFKYRTRK